MKQPERTGRCYVLRKGWLRCAVLVVSLMPAAPSWSAEGYPSEAAGSYPTHGYPWEGNTLGETDQVPAPWSPVVMEGDHLSVWGRTFELGEGAIPRQITTQDQPVFAEAPALTVRIDGRAVGWSRPEVVDAREKSVVVKTTGRPGGGTRVEATATLEYDGLWLVDLVIEPADRGVELQGVSLRLPLRKEMAESFSRYIDYDYVDQTTGVRGDTAHSYGGLDRPIRTGFNPSIWIGNRRGGIEWVCETDAGWSLRQPREAIAMTPEGDALVLQITAVDKPLRLSDTFHWRFALYPTPVKPLADHWRLSRIISQDAMPGGLDAGALEVYGVIQPGAVPLRYPGLPIADPSSSDLLTSDPSLSERQRIADPAETYRQTRQRMEDKGIHFIIYGALNFMPATMPKGEWQHYAKHWRTHISEKIGGGRNRVWGRAQDIPDDGSLTLLHTSPAHRSYQDFIVWQYVNAINSVGIEGIYFDAAAPNVSGVNTDLPFSEHVRRGGSYYPFFAERRLMQRLWVACKALDPDFYIIGHNPKMPAIISAYFDMALTGEALTAAFRREGWSIAAANADPDVYEPDYSQLPEALFSIGYAHEAIGTTNVLLPMIQINNVPLMQRDPARYERLTRILLARTLVYDIPVYPANIHFGAYTEANRGLQRFRWLRDTRYIAPADAEGWLGKLPETVRAAIYLDPQKDELLVIASNFGESPQRVQLKLDAEALRSAGVELPSDAEWSDAPTGQGLASDAPYSVSAELPAGDFRMLILKR